jgi:hypothetical protein
MVGGALTLGLEQQLGRGYAIEPFIQGEIGRFNSGYRSTTGHELGRGNSLALRN